MRWILAASFVFAFVGAAAACGGPAGRASVPAQVATSSGSPSPTPSPTPTPNSEAAPTPSAQPVFFSGLPAGTYTTHLHSACNGSQNFHVVVLDNLVIGANHSGSIEVPSGYFGRGLCVIVYANATLTSVLTTRAI